MQKQSLNKSGMLVIVGALFMSMLMWGVIWW